MDRTQAPHHIDIGSGRRGFRDQNIANGQIGTCVDAPFLNSVQEEIMAVIENAGLQAASSDWTQLWQALNRLNMPGFRGRHNWHAVKSMTLKTPPASAEIGDAYLIPANAQNDWAGHEGKIAIRDDDKWVIITPQDGHGIGLPDGQVYIRVNDQYQPLGYGQAGQRDNWRAVRSITTMAPPASAAIGDAWLIPSGAVGEWQGKAGQIAIRDDDKWVYITPQDGHGIGLPDGRIFIKHGGSYTEKIAHDVQSGKWLYAEAQGTENEITATLSPPPPALIDGLKIRLKLGETNTDAATLNINELGANPIVSFEGEPLQGGELVGATIVELIYNSEVGFHIASPVRASSLGFGRAWFDEPGVISWQVPQGITMIEVEIWGAGGGGARAGNSPNEAAGSGGSGAYVRKVMKVVPGQILTGVVGAGGEAPSWADQPSNGGTTSFAGVMTATGGLAGTMALSSPATAGAGGTASGGDININGNGGGIARNRNLPNITNTPHNIFIAGGSAPFGGTGGNGHSRNGSVPGGGGGCAVSQFKTTDLSDGGNGAIYIKW